MALERGNPPEALQKSPAVKVWEIEWATTVDQGRGQLGGTKQSPGPGFHSHFRS
jgi:hypothetical protein